MAGNELYDPAARDASDTLDGDPGKDPLDQGVAPPDRRPAGTRYGTTEREHAEGESLDQQLAKEEPEPDPYAEPANNGAYQGDDRLYGVEQQRRAGRLVAADQGAHAGAEAQLIAHDAGIDAGAASPEEAAVYEEDTEQP